MSLVIHSVKMVAQFYSDEPHVSVLVKLISNYCHYLIANGFVRSESTVALFLQREQDAKRIYAKINFSDSLYDGSFPQTILGHSEEYLRNLLSTIYERNGGDTIAADLAFMELSGSAVKV